MSTEFIRICPYCGAVIELDRCSVVATDTDAVPIRHTSMAASGAASWQGPAERRTGLPGLTDPRLADLTLADPLEDAGTGGSELAAMPPLAHPGAEPAEAAVAARSARSAVRSQLWRPGPRTAPPPPVQGWRGLFAAPEAPPRESLHPLNRFHPEQLARRICSACRHKLPVELDTRDAHILGVVGINGVGKTYYLATALTQAIRSGRLRPAGISEFEPDAETAEIFHQEYYLPVYQENLIPMATPVNAQIHRHPLIFRVTAGAEPPLLLMTHDISGDTLTSSRARATDTPFLRRASAVIFLVDPVEFEAVQKVLDGRTHRQARSVHQTDLLAATLQELRYGPEVPVAVVVSKADLLSQVCDSGASFLRDMPPVAGTAGWIQDVKRTSNEVKAALTALGEGELVEVASRHPTVTFHAVSPLGATPAPGSRQLEPRPRRTVDPLGTVIRRLAAGPRLT